MDKGYTKIDNELFDFLYSVKLSGAELQVLLFLIRTTVGFRRNTTRASYSYIAGGTGLSEASVKRIIKSFFEKGFITEVAAPVGSRERVIKLEWSKLICSCGQNRTHRGFRIDHKKVVRIEHQDNKEYIKDKDIKEKTQAAPNSFPSVHINNYTPEEAREWQEVLSQEDWKDFINGKVW